jgi:hypothetical protein
MKELSGVAVKRTLTHTHGCSFRIGYLLAVSAVTTLQTELPFVTLEIFG